MELRSYNHFHYIHAIKGGLMTKVSNINSRGKPAVVFKKLTDIYEFIDEEGKKSLPTRWSRESLEENIPEGYKFKVETEDFYAERKLFKDEPGVSDSDSGGDTYGQKSDVEADSMTIQQIMEACKKRKSRQSKSVDSSKEELRTWSEQELKRSCLLSDEDDSDLNVALSIWQSKLSRRKKLKTKCNGSIISTSSQCGQITGNSDPINSDKDLLPSSADLPIPVNIKVETPETDVTEIQNTNYIIGELSLLCDENVNSCLSSELSLLCDENVNSCLSSEPIGADELFLNQGSTTSKKEAEYCVLNSACDEYLEGDDPEYLQMVGESSTQWTKKDNLEIHKPNYSDFPASDSSMEGQYAPRCVSSYSMSEAISLTEEQWSGTNISQGKSIIHEAICQNNGEDMSEEISLTGEQCTDTYISEGKSLSHETICPNNGEVLNHLHGMTNLNSLQLREMSCRAQVCLTEKKDRLELDHEKKGISTAYTSDCNLRTDHGENISTKSTTDCNLSPDHGESISTKSTSDCNLSPDHEKSISTCSTSDCSLNPDQHLISIGKCPAKEIEPQIFEYSDSERNCSPDFHLDESMDKFNQFEEPKRHPTRLLSTRTTISPTSQERLSKAMKSMRLHDKECKTCGGKPYFKQAKYKVGTAEECDQMKRAYSDVYQEPNIRRSKKRSLHSTSNPKVLHVSTRSTAIQSCSDNAIAFTQRQMQDIESIALKLTNQLKQMKAIAEDRLHVEGNKATSFKFNTDEVRTAISDATKAEASAKKWLSMMSRDCNRFCKIMKTTENGSTASPSAIQKVKRKITFADEAGGKLCEVRLIEDDVESETSREKYETVK